MSRRQWVFFWVRRWPAVFSGLGMAAFGIGALMGGLGVLPAALLAGGGIGVGLKRHDDKEGRLLPRLAQETLEGEVLVHRLFVASAISVSLLIIGLVTPALIHLGLVPATVTIALLGMLALLAAAGVMVLSEWRAAR